MSKLNVKKGDLVLVTVGDEKEKGKKGKIIAADPDKGKVVVENVNIVKRHTKPRSAQQQGGIIEKPRAIDASNVQLVCPKCGKATKVAHVFDEAGKAVRQCKKCKAIIDTKADKTEKKAAEKKVAKKAKAE